MPKISLRDGLLNSQIVTNRLAAIEKNQDFRANPEVMSCITELKPHSVSIANLLNDNSDRR